MGEMKTNLDLKVRLRFEMNFFLFKIFSTLNNLII